MIVPIGCCRFLSVTSIFMISKFNDTSISTIVTLFQDSVFGTALMCLRRFADTVLDC